MYSTTIDRYMMGSGFVNNSKIQGDFTFKTFHTYSGDDFWVSFFTKVSKSPFFFIGYVSLLIISSLGAFFVHRRGTSGM